MSIPELVVYSRPGCHVCEELVEELLPLVRKRALVTIRNIDEDPALVERYGRLIPVVCANDRVLCKFRLDRDAILRALVS